MIGFRRRRILIINFSFSNDFFFKYKCNDRMNIMYSYFFLYEFIWQETEGLEQKKQSLQEEIQQLQQAKDELEFILEAHRAVCRLRSASPPDVKPVITDERSNLNFEPIRSFSILWKFESFEHDSILKTLETLDKSWILNLGDSIFYSILRRFERIFFFFFLRFIRTFKSL